MNSKFARKYIKNAHSSYGSGHDNSPTGDDMKIFKLGLDRKELADNPNFIAEYLKFFIEKNDHISKFLESSYINLNNYLTQTSIFRYPFSL